MNLLALVKYIIIHDIWMYINCCNLQFKCWWLRTFVYFLLLSQLQMLTLMVVIMKQSKKMYKMQKYWENFRTLNKAWSIIKSWKKNMKVLISIVLGYTYVLAQLSFCLFPSILLFVFTYFWSHLLIFGALMGYFWCWSRVQQLFWGLLM